MRQWDEVIRWIQDASSYTIIFICTYGWTDWFEYYEIRVLFYYSEKLNRLIIKDTVIVGYYIF